MTAQQTSSGVTEAVPQVGRLQRLSRRSARARPSNKVRLLASAQEVIDLWPFFLEGHKALNDPLGARGEMSVDAYFRCLTQVAAASNQDGFVLLITSKNDKPLGFGVVVDGTDMWHEKRIALGQLMWSNGKSPNLCVDIAEATVEVCRQLGFERLYTASRRSSGAATRLFQTRMGFTFAHNVLCRDL